MKAAITNKSEWDYKVNIANEVLNILARTKHDRKSRLSIWRLKKELKQNSCPKCGCPSEIIDSGSAMGTEWETYRCANCKHEFSEFPEDHEHICSNCGKPLPIIDADYNGPKYGQCPEPKCFGEIADVWNPKPNVFLA